MTALLPACVVEDDVGETSSAATTGGGGGGVVTTPSESGALYMKFQTAWETTPGAYETLGTCSIPAGSPRGTTLTCSAASAAPARFIIPEGKLYFSKVKITMGTATANTCKILVFYPYYYKVDDTGGCAGPSASAACYAGMGMDLLDYDNGERGYYRLTALEPEFSLVADSANSSGVGTNRYMANGLTDESDAALTYAGLYVPNSMVNYTAECRDQWFDLVYTVKVKLSDEDYDAFGAADDFPDWD